jgi:hypothetical protein
VQSSDRWCVRASLQVEKPTPNSPSNDGVYQYANHNFTVANFWAPFLVRHEMIDEDGPAHTGLWNLYLDEPDAVWSPRVAAFDYVVVSASSWFYRPSMLYEAGRLVGCYYCLRPNVTGLTLNYALRAATRTALRVLAGGGADGHHGRFRGTAVLRTVSPSQYENGGWNKDGDCVRSRPHQRGEKRMEGFELDFHKLQVLSFVLHHLFPLHAKRKESVLTYCVRAVGGVCSRGRGCEGCRRRGPDDADGHDGGDGAPCGRAPQQAQGIHAGEALPQVQGLRALVHARGHRYLE